MPPEPISWSSHTRRPARTDPLDQQRVGSFRRAAELLAADDVDGARALLAYAIDHECTPIHELFAAWRAELRLMLGEMGMDPLLREREEDRMRRGSGGVHEDVAWEGFMSSARSVGDRPTIAAATGLAEHWRIVHDREVDVVHGLMAMVTQIGGEAGVPAMVDRIAAEHREHYLDLARDRPWSGEGREAVLLDTLEAMRAHLSSPDRDGAPFELVEHDDRWEMSFDPCGSGGRSGRDRHTGGIIARAYDWTDGRAGLCIYCAHCLLVYEHAPMDAVGHPYLVVDPPEDPGGVCRYRIYKDPELVPDDVWSRAGRRRPR